MAKDTETVSVNNISRISSGTMCTGTINSKYDLRIDGAFEGKMHSKGRIVIGEGASITGDVVCDNIDLWGKLSGTIYVKDTLSLKSGCSLNGSINVRKFVVELGSEFNGSCRMITAEDYAKEAEKIEAELSGGKAAEQAAPANEKKPAK